MSESTQDAKLDELAVREVAAVLYVLSDSFDGSDGAREYAEAIVKRIAELRAPKAVPANVMTDALTSAYSERATCVALALKLAAQCGYSYGVAVDETVPDWPVVMIDLPTGQVSWHFSRADFWRCFPTGLCEYKGAWDGHDSAEKYNRCQLYAPKAVAVPEPATWEEWEQARSKDVLRYIAKRIMQVGWQDSFVTRGIVEAPAAGLDRATEVLHDNLAGLDALYRRALSERDAAVRERDAVLAAVDEAAGNWAAERIRALYRRALSAREVQS